MSAAASAKFSTVKTAMVPRHSSKPPSAARRPASERPSQRVPRAMPASEVIATTRTRKGSMPGLDVAGDAVVRDGQDLLHGAAQEGQAGRRGCGTVMEMHGR